MEDDGQDRGDEENEQNVETFGKDEEVNGWRDNAQSDTWRCMCANVRENTRCDGVLSTKSGRKSSSGKILGKTRNDPRLEAWIRLTAIRRSFWKHKETKTKSTLRH